MSDPTSADVASLLDDLHARASATETKVRRLEAATRHHFQLLPWRVAAAILAVVWTSLLLIGLAWASFVIATDPLYCDHPDESSRYGDLSWSILPPGPQCSWGSGLDTEVQEPTPVMSIWLVLLLIIGGLTLSVARHGRIPEVHDPPG